MQLSAMRSGRLEQGCPRGPCEQSLSWRSACTLPSGVVRIPARTWQVNGSSMAQVEKMTLFYPRDLV